MTKKVVTLPNTFYIKKALEDDTGISETYADLYQGTAATFDLVSNPNTTYLVGESRVIDTNTYPYGEGEITKMYLYLYANSIVREDTNPPAVSVFAVKESFPDFTEGNMVDISEDTGLLTTFTSTCDFTLPWLTEDFDMVEKHFHNQDARAMPRARDLGAIMSGYQINLPAGLIVIRQWQEELDEVRKNKATEVINNQSPYVLNTGPIGNRIFRGLQDLGNDASDSLRNLTWDPEWAKWQEGFVNLNISADEFDVGGKWADTMVNLVKDKNGLYYFDLGAIMNTSGKLQFKYLIEIAENRGMPLSSWIQAGAVGVVGMMPMIGGTEYTPFSVDYLAPATPANTIFSDVFGDADVRDIKAQSQEGPGDNTSVLAYGNAHIQKADVFTGENAMDLTLSWENYADDGDRTNQSGTTALNIANCFGRNATYGTAHTQDLALCMYGLPLPINYDQSRLAMDGRAYAPELEIVFKVKSLPLAPTFKAASAVAGTEINRSFNIMGAPTAPTGEEDMIGGYEAVTAGYESYWFSFLNMGSLSANGGKVIDVLGNAGKEDYGGASTVSEGHIYLTNSGACIGTQYHTQIPYDTNEWITARIKFISNAQGFGTNIMMYFPHLTDSDGEVLYLQGFSTGNWTQPEQWFNHFTIWMNNMRSINQNPAYGSSDINNHYVVDVAPNEDKNVQVIIDSISLYGWGYKIDNSTVTEKNGMGSLIYVDKGTWAVPQPISSGASANEWNTAVKISRSATGAGGKPDNLYSTLSVPTATYFSIGYDAPASWTPGDAYDKTSNLGPATGSLFTEGHHLLFSDFTTNPVSAIENLRPIPQVSAAAFKFRDGSPYKGYPYDSDYFNPDYDTVGGLLVGEGDDAHIRIGGFDNAVDRFTQKGLIRISGSLDTVNDGFKYWRRTGNPFVSSHILDVEENGNVLVVDNPSIFDLPRDTNYVIQRKSPKAYGDNTKGTYASYWSGASSMGYMGATTGLSGAANELYVESVQGNRVTLNRSVLEDDAGNLVLSFNTSATEFGLNEYFISPYKFWITLAFMNYTGTNGEVWGGAWSASDIPYDYEPIYNASVSDLPARSYSTMVAVSGGSVAGTTYNEELFTDASTYKNHWNLSLVDVKESDLLLNIPFTAAGSVEEGDIDIGDDSGKGKIGSAEITEGPNLINITSYANTVKPKGGAHFNFFLKPSVTDLTLPSRTVINMNTDDATTDPLTVIYGLKDPVPLIRDLAISPMLDIGRMESIPVVIEPNDSNVSVQWTEENNDTWYRLLFVDSNNIQNKYHQTNFWAPLGGVYYSTKGKVGGYPAVAEDFKYYLSGQTNATEYAFQNSGTTVVDIEGFCGYGAVFDGTNDFLYVTGTTVLADEASKWSCLLHCKPAAGVYDGTIFDIVTPADPVTNSMARLDLIAGRVVFTHSSSATVLTSVTAYNCDGLQPLAILLTYDKDVPDNNWKLHINGVLSDTSDLDTGITISGNMFIGASGTVASAGGGSGDNFFTGFIEEMTSYDMVLHMPPNINLYQLSTKGNQDLVTAGTNSVFYNSRLFLMDYHNIRGRSSSEVAMSDQASWKVTGPSLTWESYTIGVYEEAVATINFNDTDVKHIYVDWDDGEDNSLDHAIFQWKKLETDSNITTLKHTYTKKGTFYPVIRTINSTGFLSKYFYDNSMPDSSTIPFPKQEVPNISGLTVTDGAPLSNLKIENKIVKSGIDNDIFQEGPKSVYVFVPPIMASGATVLNKVNKIKVKYVEAAYTYKDTTVNLDLGYERIVKETELTLPALDVSQAATLLTSDSVVEILDVRLVTPRIDTDINSVRNDFNKLKFFLIAQGDDTYWYPITYVSNGDPIKTADGRVVTLDFSQSRAKASNTSISSYKYDDGKAFFNPVREWQAVSATDLTNETRTTLSLLNKGYTYYTRPDGLKGGSLGLGSGTAFATGASNYYDTDNFSFKRDQFPLHNFNQFYDQYHLGRITASSSGITNSTLDTYEGVYRITPVISTSAANSFYLDQQALSQTAFYTSGAYYNTTAYPVEVSGWNTMPFIDNDAEARQASEYLLLFNDVKTNKIFFNNTPYAKALMSNLTTGTTGNKIAGVYYLKLSEAVEGDLFTQKAEWRPVKFRDTTKVAKEVRDASSGKYLTYEDTMTKSGFIEFDMPSDWSQISASGLCGGLFNNVAAGVVLTGDYSKPVTVTGWVSQVASPFYEYEVSTSSLSSYTNAQIGKYNYTYQVVSGNNSGNTYWVASSNTVSNTLYLVSGASNKIVATNNAGEALNGIMRRVNAYDVFDGAPKTTDLAASKGDVPNADDGVYPYTFMWGSSAFRTDLAANFNNVYPLKIVLSGAHFISGSRLSSGPELWDILPYNNSYSQVIVQQDNTAYDLSYMELTNDISMTYAGTYYQAISKGGNVFIKRTGTPIQSIGFGGNALGDEQSFSFNEEFTSYDTLRLLRRIEADGVRVMWDEQQKDSTYVRFFGYVNNVSETHQVSGKRASRPFNFTMVIEEICLLDTSGNLMSDVEPLGGSPDDKGYE